MRQGKILGTLLLLPTFMLAAANIGTLATGQTTQYVAGDDGTYKQGTIRSFTRNADTPGEEYVTDNVTGLVWQDDTAHKDNPVDFTTASGTTCQALNTASYGGFDDWRMPTIKEMATLIDASSTTVFSSTFVNLPSPVANWSSTLMDSDNSMVWVVEFDGNIRTAPATNSLSVRCVRGDSYPASSFVRSSDIVTDQTTNLMWQDNSAVSTSRDTWMNPSTCDILNLGGYTDWRIPNRNELESLINRSKTVGIDTNIFNNCPSGEYWSSTTIANNTTNSAWVAALGQAMGYEGQIGMLQKTSGIPYTRCVRNNIPPTASDYTYTTTVTGLVSFDWNSATTLNPQDSDGSIASAAIKTQGSKGTASISGNTVTYAPNAKQSGSDTFVLTITDNDGSTVNATVTISSLDTSAASLSYLNTLAEGSGSASIDGSVVITLNGDSFPTDAVSASHVIASNVPNGLSASFSRDNDYQITLTLTGLANSHTSGDSISNLTVTFDDDAFATSVAADVTNATKSDLVLPFYDGFLGGTVVGGGASLELLSGNWNMVSFPNGFTVDTLISMGLR